MKVFLLLLLVLGCLHSRGQQFKPVSPFTYTQVCYGQFKGQRMMMICDSAGQINFKDSGGTYVLITPVDSGKLVRYLLSGIRAFIRSDSILRASQERPLTSKAVNVFSVHNQPKGVWAHYSKKSSFTSSYGMGYGQFP